MNGECKSYRLNEPMKYEEFKAMPDDIKISYITLLRKKFNCPDSKIGEMMGANKDKISRQFIKLGLDKGKTRKKENWDKEGFYAWVHGVSKLPTTGIEEPIETPVVEEAPIQEACFETPDYKETEGIQDSKFVEDDLPFEEKDMQEIEWLRKECEGLRIQVRILEAQMDVVRMIFGGNKRS